MFNFQGGDFVITKGSDGHACKDQDLYELGPEGFGRNEGHS